MLTLDTTIRALRHAFSYGLTPRHRFGDDHAGVAEFCSDNADSPIAQRCGWVRRWDADKGAYVYVEVTRA